jgi:retinol dehydrogenase 14
MRTPEKAVLVTGANSGVGFATAKALADQGAAIIMVCRNKARGIAAKRDIEKAAKGPEPVLLTADLSSQAEIQALAEDVHSRFSRLDVLLNNAGAIFAQRELTADGIEKTFAVNHLAPFLLTNLLMDLLRAAQAARIVTVASESYAGSLDFTNLQGERHYNFLGAYARTKLCNILFTYELSRRLAGTKITANSMSPGPTVTRFGDNMTGVPALFPAIMKRIPFLFAPPEKGARTLIQLASSQGTEGVSGRFFLRGRERRTQPITYDREAAARLWRISEQLCRIPAASLP